MHLEEVYRLFPTERDCVAYLEGVRWHGIPLCPYCTSCRSTPLPKEARYHCNECNLAYSVTVGTVFHHTHLPLQKWFLAIALMLNARRNIPIRQLAHDLEVNKNTAWYVVERIRRSMIGGNDRQLLEGIADLDDRHISSIP